MVSWRQVAIIAENLLQFLGYILGISMIIFGVKHPQDWFQTGIGLMVSYCCIKIDSFILFIYKLGTENCLIKKLLNRDYFQKKIRFLKKKILYSAGLRARHPTSITRTPTPTPSASSSSSLSNSPRRRHITLEIEAEETKTNN